MKKIFVLICLLFLSGCSVNYEITLDEDKIEEKLTLVETNQNLFDIRNDSGWTIREIFDSLVANATDEFSTEDYSVKSLNNDTQLGVEYRIKNDTLINSSAVNQCYTNPTMETNNNIVTFNTGSEFNCYEYYDNLDEINIVLKTNYKVISSNADEVKGNKYIWNITKDGNKQIEISYDTSVNNRNNFVITIIIIVIVVMIVFSAYYIYSKKKKENTI